MTFAALPGGSILMPPDLSVLIGSVTAATVTNQTLMTFDGSGDKLAWIGQVPKTGTITELLFHTGTVSTAGATFRMRLETVDSSMLPSGTLYTANAEGTVVVATSDDAVWKTVSINSGTGVSVTAGDVVAVVLEVSSGTPNVVQIGVAPTWMAGQGFPFCATNTSGSWAKFGASNLSIPFMMNYGGTFVFAPGMNAAHTVGVQTIGNGNERAMRFQAPMPMQLSGAKIALLNVSAGADFTVLLTDDAGTTLWSKSYDGDGYLGTTVDAFAFFQFDTTYDFALGDVGYLSVRQDTANSLQTYEATFSSASHMDAAPGGGEFYLGTRTGAGAFSDTTTTRPLMHLMVAGLDDGTGGATPSGTRAILPAGLGAMG